MIEMCQTLGIPHDSKSLIYSDSLNMVKCLEIKKQCDELGFTKGKLIACSTFFIVH
jgi:nicotinate phosphoribosyltransferase